MRGIREPDLNGARSSRFCCRSRLDETPDGCKRRRGSKRRRNKQANSRDAKPRSRIAGDRPIFFCLLLSSLPLSSPPVSSSLRSLLTRCQQDWRLTQILSLRLAPPTRPVYPPFPTGQAHLVEMGDYGPEVSLSKAQIPANPPRFAAEPDEISVLVTGFGVSD